MSSFVVETGAGLETATSYVSVAYADAYFDQFGGSPDWASADTSGKQVALNRASRSVDQLFGARYQSYPAWPDRQALLFPRAHFYINGGTSVTSSSIPRSLKDAVCEIALLDLLGEDIYPNISESSSVKKENIKIGPLDFSTEYSGSTTNEYLSGFYKIELLLGPLLLSGGTVNNIPAFMAL